MISNSVNKPKTHPLAHTYVILYNDSIDTDELEQKFSKKYNFKTLKDYENNISINNSINNSNKPIPNVFINQCIKVDNNIFELVNKDGDNILLDWIIFIKDGKKYHPEKFTISIQNKIKKTIYRVLIENPNNYTFANIPIPIKFDSNYIFDIKILIEDTKQIEQVLLGLKYNVNNFANSFILDTHKLLYSGKKCELKLSKCNFVDLIIIGENIFDITVINDNYPLFNNIPIQLLEIRPNTYSCKSIFDNFKSDKSDKFVNTYNNNLFNTQTQIEILINKNPKSLIKIYGNQI